MDFLRSWLVSALGELMMAQQLEGCGNTGILVKGEGAPIRVTLQIGDDAIFFPIGMRNPRVETLLGNPGSRVIGKRVLV